MNEYIDRFIIEHNYITLIIFYVVGISIYIAPTVITQYLIHGKRK